MNSGLSPFSISGGMIVSVIADAAIYRMSVGTALVDTDGEEQRTGTITFVLMLCLAPSRAIVLVKPTRPTTHVSIIA